MRPFLLFLAAVCLAHAETVELAGLEKPVEILRDRWGVVHIYAQTPGDLFLAQGYMAARDRLWQIDLWRRVGAGKLAEVLGPQALPRDRIARLVRFRGDWNAEWRSYSPDTRAIAAAFARGVNAYVRSLGGRRPLEFRLAGYDPGLWEPEDCVARIAGLLMTRNVAREVARTRDIARYGIDAVQKYLPPDPFVKIVIPTGLDLADIVPDVLRDYTAAIGSVGFPHLEGSNNWVVDGTRTATGKPLLASDPHRPVNIPSLRKTWHLVAPGWNVIGAGEPALPGVALGHNERIAWGLTIVGIDQADLYVERLNPANPDEYLYRGAWRKIERERQSVKIRGSAAPQPVELRYTIHGPVIYEDRKRQRAYALRWVGAEPGGAGYLAALAVSRAGNWREFLAALERYKIPSQNVIYADTDGNIGWQASGLTPVRKNWSGLLPVPGHTGEYEWSGFLTLDQMPRSFNPPSHFLATANHNILPPGYTKVLGYEWAQPFRHRRVLELLAERRKFTLADFERMQQDVVSIPARRFQQVLKRWTPPRGRASEAVRRLLAWDAALTVNSTPAAIFEFWIARLPAFVFGSGAGAGGTLEMLLNTLEASPHPKALADSLELTLNDMTRELGPKMDDWKWGRVHTLNFDHPLGAKGFSRGPVSRPGDANTVNATSGAALRQTAGASYRHVVDLADWDRSTMTNVPGESGNPASSHYADLIDDWAAGRYHPMPFSRKAVEAATGERIALTPAQH